MVTYQPCPCQEVDKFLIQTRSSFLCYWFLGSEDCNYLYREWENTVANNDNMVMNTSQKRVYTYPDNTTLTTSTAALNSRHWYRRWRIQLSHLQILLEILHVSNPRYILLQDVNILIFNNNVHDVQYKQPVNQTTHILLLIFYKNWLPCRLVEITLQVWGIFAFCSCVCSGKFNQWILSAMTTPYDIYITPNFAYKSKQLFRDTWSSCIQEMIWRLDDSRLTHNLYLKSAKFVKV